jgi:hypothetical protein
MFHGASSALRQLQQNSVGVWQPRSHGIGYNFQQRMDASTKHGQKRKLDPYFGNEQLCNTIQMSLQQMFEIYNDNGCSSAVYASHKPVAKATNSNSNHRANNH